MKRALPIALIALVLSVGASFADAPHTATAGHTAIAAFDGLNLDAVPDLATVIGGARSHSCRANAAIGAILTNAGQAIGSPVLAAIGTYLTYLSMAICV